MTAPREGQGDGNGKEGPEEGAHAEPVTITPVSFGPDRAGARGIIPAFESPADPMDRDTIVILDDLQYANNPAAGRCVDMFGLISGQNTVVADNALNSPQAAVLGKVGGR